MALHLIFKSAPNSLCQIIAVVMSQNSHLNVSFILNVFMILD